MAVFKRLWQNLIKKGANWLFPIRCLSCERPGYYLCPACAAKILIFENARCPFCGRFSAEGRVCGECAPVSSLDQALAAAYFKDSRIKKVVHHLKYASVSLAARDLAQVMAGTPAIRRVLTASDAPWLVPIPLHRKKENQRGYNQAELLARNLSLITGAPVRIKLLRRRKQTRTQMAIKERAARQANVAGAFECEQAELGAPAGLTAQKPLERPGFRRVALIDDVMTTGATLESAAKCLKKAGVREVIALTVARQIRENN